MNRGRFVEPLLNWCRMNNIDVRDWSSYQKCVNAVSSLPVDESLKALNIRDDFFANYRNRLKSMCSRESVTEWPEPFEYARDYKERTMGLLQSRQYYDAFVQRTLNGGGERI